MNEKEKDIHCGHRERFRKRFIEVGVSGFQSHELIELMLFYVIPVLNTNETAHRLIDRFGSISGIMNANIDELKQVDGIGDNSAMFIKFMADVCRSYAFSVHHNTKFSSSDDIEKYISDYFTKSESEVCIFLNVSPQFELLDVISLPMGDIGDNIYSARNLAEITIRHSLRKIIIGQNHFGKMPVPNNKDYKLLKIITETLTPLGVEVYDFITYGMTRTFSMRKNGAFSLN